ncbi:DnaA N-terminal domain-containing protein [Litoreibacter janthinus]|uniref:DnaA N-terminal domain-containing protein n=1 Tax=Litoreibacter janthinus TaxID=670154 RepID=A0A1I6ICD7_9RHOB|nr:DnaA N-terminal domain-containing protein [Litoreibacter janthinus]SFR64346.1 DnaA N-terminal domain-containing protein [Litoreibacter janthinus]
MQSPKAVGRQAAARKYDIITALGTYALARGKHEHRLVLRLLTLITARYNWQRNELAVGQREIAQMWSVDERTVKREMAKLRAMGWLVVRRQGARGRVTEYSMNFDRMMSDTSDDWSKVGPDFNLRMHGGPEPESGQIVPMPARGVVPAPDLKDGTAWALAQAVLHSEDPANYGSWFHALKCTDVSGGRMTLLAPSRFHAAYVQSHFATKLLRVCQSVEAGVSQVIITE